MRYYFHSPIFSSLKYMHLSDMQLLSFINKNHFNPNANWFKDNPVLHFLLANEYYEYIERLIRLIPDRRNANLCDGPGYGKKSLLILMTLLPPDGVLVFQFIEQYKAKINFDYQDMRGRSAMHYAVILGRYDLFCKLRELGASDTLTDHEQRTPLSYINCSEELILNTLKSVDIKGLRDAKATRNMIVDSQFLPIYLRGKAMIQNKDSVDQLLKTDKISLVTYTTQSEYWGMLSGDDTAETVDEMHRFAEGVAKSHHIPLSEVYSPTLWSGDDSMEFRVLLEHSSTCFAGVSILEECLLGHKKIADQQSQHAPTVEQAAKPFY